MLRLLPLLLALAGCDIPVAVGGPCDPFATGEAPCKEQLYFPTGVAADPDGDVLYVSNGNADLRYSGGTVMAIDLRRLECWIGYVRSGYTAAPEGCAETDLEVRAGCTAPGKIAASKSNHDGCKANLLDPTVVECDECGLILGAVKVGNFGAGIQLQRLDDGEWNRRLWLPVRGDPSVTYIDVRKDGAATTLSCVDPSNPQPGKLPDACSEQRITVWKGSGATEDPALAPEPFGVALDQGKLADGSPYARLLVTHLSGGELTLIDGIGKRVLDVYADLFGANASGKKGGFAVAARTPGQPGGLWYATSRANAFVGMVRVSDEGYILPAGGFSVGGGVFSVGDDVRGLAFDGDGRRALVIENNPPALFAVDTRLAEDGLPRNVVVDEVPLCQGPSQIGLRRVVEGGVTRTLAYVVCNLTGQVMIVDPDLPLVRDAILVGGGANAIAFSPGVCLSGQSCDASGCRCDGRSSGPRAYVTNYNDMTVSAIDLERGSPTENRVIGRIGLTR